MFPDFGKLLGQLTTPSDVAIVGGAALVGFALDLGLNVVGVLSPAACAGGAGSAALVAKRGWEARREARKQGKLLNLYLQEADRLAAKLAERGLTNAAEHLTFERNLATSGGDMAAFRAAIENARSEL